MALTGWLIINKPLHISSAQAVGRVKRLLGRENKIGHAGTLDPLATGILPLAIGEATKVVQYLLDSDKEYEFEVTWGQERSTDDAEGEVVSESENKPHKSEVLAVMKSFVGEIEQMPPNYSALKVDGNRAYDLARAGKEVKLVTRKVTIHNLELLEISETTAAFRMACSKGTYVRSIARDMGHQLGCYGYVSKLHRSRHGQFSINHAISLEKLEELCQKGVVASSILPLEEVLDGIPAFPLDEFEAAKIRNGVSIINRLKISGEIIALYFNGKLLAIADSDGIKLQPKRVFNH